MPDSCQYFLRRANNYIQNFLSSVKYYYMVYNADFVSAEERKECLITGKPFQSRSLNRYLRVETIEDHGFVLRAKFQFRHPSLYRLESGPWTYLNEYDLRSISPIIEFREKQKPFFISLGNGFLQVKDIRIDDEKDLIFILENPDAFCLN